MKTIAQFYTLFWIIYFPTCIAFNELDGFGWIDEIMTVILMAFTFLNSSVSLNREPRGEYRLFLGILAFYVVYGLIFGENIEKAVLRDMVQWIRPFSVIYCTWILNPRFTERQKNVMLISMLVTLGAWFLYHPEVNVGADAEFPVLGQLAMCTGMTWYLWKPDNQKNAYIALAIVLSGMLAPKFKFMGEVVCFVGFVFFLHGKLQFKSPKTILALVVLLAVTLYVTWEKFDIYYVSGLNSNELARPMTYRIAFTEIIWDYFPFGPGMGTWGCAAAADYYSPLLYKYHMSRVWGCDPTNPMFVADAFYPTLAQLGVVGIILFCIFWRRRLVAMNEIEDMRYYRVAWITFFCLLIEQTADTSFLSGKGMGFCMLLALCLNANRNMEEEEDEEEEDEEDGEELAFSTSEKNAPLVREN